MSTGVATGKEESVSITNSLGLIVIHVVSLTVFLTGVSWAAVAAGAFVYFIRMFAITAGYHRYFSHRTYKTSRLFQFVLAFIGCSSAQNGPIWWGSHHRRHHLYSDTDKDVHSPVKRGFFWAHLGWILQDRSYDADLANMKDFSKFPELRLLERFHYIPCIFIGAVLFCIGEWSVMYRPEWNTYGWQMVVVGFFCSTMVLYHCTFFVNSICHIFGFRRFETDDRSRNNWWVAILTLGEGWHNNHHHSQTSERQGRVWWEYDVSHYILTVLSWVGIVWDIRGIAPAKAAPSETTAKAA